VGIHIFSSSAQDFFSRFYRFYLTSEFYIRCKKDGLEKMKIEKMGEKKEELRERERLGKCYSISTKNGTLLKSQRFCILLNFLF